MVQRKGGVMDDRGYLKLSRSIQDNPLYFTESFTRMQAYIDMMFLANHSETEYYIRGLKVIVSRGQVPRSKEFLGTRWRWSRGKVLRFLDDLEKRREVVQQKSSVITLVSMLKYNDYTVSDTTDSTTDSTTDGTTYKNVKNLKNVKERKILKDFSECSFVRNDFREVFKMWLDFKAEKKKSYKGEKSAELCYKKLISLSGDSVEVAKKIIEQSMSNNWEGLFELSATNKATQPEPIKKGLNTWKAGQNQ